MTTRKPMTILTLLTGTLFLVYSPEARQTAQPKLEIGQLYS